MKKESWWVDNPDTTQAQKQGYELAQPKHPPLLWTAVPTNLNLQDRPTDPGLQLDLPTGLNLEDIHNIGQQQDFQKESQLGPSRTKRL